MATTTKAKVSVNVVKNGPGGIPVAQVRISSNVSAAQLGSALQKIVTNDKVFKVAGLQPCGGCKSGLDINILGDLQEVIEFEV